MNVTTISSRLLPIVIATFGASLARLRANFCTAPFGFCRLRISPFALMCVPKSRFRNDTTLRT